MMAALPLIRRWWPAAVVLALIAASWWHGQQRYRAGMAACEARWQAAQAAAERTARAKAATREAVKEQANAEAAEKIEIITQTEVRYVDRIKEIWRDRDDHVCLDADGMRLIAQADRDRAAAAQPAGGRAD